MKAFVTRLMNPDHGIDDFKNIVGTSDQMVVSNLKTEKDIWRRAASFANGRPYQIEIYYDNDKVYGIPNKTIIHF